MKSIAVLCLFAASAQAVLRRFDDADPIISYQGNWVHEDLDSPRLYEGTQAFTQDPSASFSFSFVGTRFALCAGLKNDRGAFTVQLDGVTAGTGTQFSASTDAAPVCETVFSVSNLANVRHDVVVANAASTYLTIDSITLDLDEAAIPATSVSSTSSITSSTSSAPSSTIDTAAIAASSAAALASQSSASTAALASLASRASASQASVSRASAAAAAASSAGRSATSAPSGGGTPTGAIAGGIVGGIAAIAIAAVLAWFCCVRKRKRSQESDAGHHNPFVSDHDTEENSGDYSNMIQTDHSPVTSYSASSMQSPVLPQPSYPTGRGFAMPLVAPLPYPGHTDPSSPAARGYSNQFFPTFSPQSARSPQSQAYGEQNFSTRSRGTSFASAITSPAPPPSRVVSKRMSVPVERDGPSEQPSDMFPTDVDAPHEDPYGGMADESTDDLNGSEADRRPSEVDLVATSGLTGRSTKRKPPPQA